jgi:hypothetical protein
MNCRTINANLLDKPNVRWLGGIMIDQPLSTVMFPMPRWLLKDVIQVDLRLDLWDLGQNSQVHPAVPFGIQNAFHVGTAVRCRPSRLFWYDM